MAQDYAGLLTGLDKRPPNPMAGMDREGRMAYRAQGMADTMGRGLVTSLGMDARTDQERTRDTIGSLKLNTTDKLQQERNVKTVREVDPIRAQKLAQMYEAQNLAADEKKLGMDTQLTQRTQFASYLDKTYPDKGYGELALQGVVTPANMKDFIKEASEEKADTSYIDILNSEGESVKALVSNSSGNVIKTFNREGKETDDKVNTAIENIVVDGKSVKALINKDNGSIIKTYGLPTDSSGLTQEQKTYNAIVASNAAEGIPTATYTNWRKGEIAEKNMSPKRREYAELKESAGEGADFPSYEDWHNKQNLDTVVTSRIDKATGIETSFLTNAKSGDVIKELGVTSMPTLEIQKNSDGTYSVYNPSTGSLSEPVATAESAALKQKQFYATMSAINSIDGTLGALSEAQRLKSDGEDGEAVGGIEYTLLGFLPETDARLLGSKVKTIQANLAFDKLQNMRDNSPTGGALGQVSNLELDLLKAAVEDLDPKLGVEAFNAQVVKIANHYNRFKQSLLEQSDYVVDPVTQEIYITSPDGKIYKVGTQAQEVK